MKRRQFIKIAGLTAGLTGLSSSLMGCSSAPSIELIGRDNKQLNQDDIRLKVIAYAMLSPNPHNKQPWRIVMTGPKSFYLYVDMFRLLPATDPYHRQIHLGQGTFLESLSIAAHEFDHDADIQYFPEGMYGPEEIVEKPVARITLLDSTRKNQSRFFDSLMRRQSIKTPYDNYQLTPKELKYIETLYNYDDFPLTFSSHPDTVQTIRRTLIEAMKIEDQGSDRVHETVSMFRFNDEELLKYQDGFGVVHSGITGIKKIVVEHVLLNRDKVEKDPGDFGKKAIELTEEQANSASSFGWMTSATNTRLDQVKAGRAYCKTHLILTQMGLAMHPMSQVLQEYADMLPLQKRFLEQLNVPKGHTMQMIFRVGHAESTAYTPRRQVQSLLKA